MRFTHIAALACVSLATIGMAAPVHLQAPVEETAITPRPIRRRRRALAPASGSCRRSRGPAAKPKRRSNMNTVSRRVRRKHRRAA